VGDLIRAYARAKEDKIDFNLIAIPDEFQAVRDGPFNPAYMKPLYETGYAIGRVGIRWRKVPPGVSSAE